MARITIRRNPLRIEQLEDRCVLAGLPWPVATPDIVGILSSYGQFQDGSIHFHEGLDIVVSTTKYTTVRAIETGTVMDRSSNGNYSDFVSIASTDDHGWNYIHMTPTVAKGATVQQGDPIGKVVLFGQRTHLHIDAAGGKDPSNTLMLRPIDDPLARLDPAVVADGIAPTLGAVHFMRGEDDNKFPHNLTGGYGTGSSGNYKLMQQEVPRRENHGYFESQDFSKAWVVGHLAPAQTGSPSPTPLGGTSNIEVIANATDRIMGNWVVGVRSLDFSAVGKFSSQSISTVRPYDFVDQFVWDPLQPQQPAGIQDYNALRISDLTRVAYENDYRSPSNGDTSKGAVSFFHILTSTDALTTVVDFADRNRYWRSKVTQGAGWNDIASVEAVNNAKGAFPDDYYTFTITAKDAAGNSTSKTERVLLDNWVQLLDVTATANPSKFTLSGSQFLPNAKVPLYARLVNGVLSEGMTLSDHAVLVGTANTDADGKFTGVLVDIPAGTMPVFVADYGAEGTYQPRLDAIGLLQVEGPGPMLRGAGLQLPLDELGSDPSSGGGGGGPEGSGHGAGGSTSQLQSDPATTGEHIGGHFLAPDPAVSQPELGEPNRDSVPPGPVLLAPTEQPAQTPRPVLLNSPISGSMSHADAPRRQIDDLGPNDLRLDQLPPP